MAGLRSAINLIFQEGRLKDLLPEQNLRYLNFQHVMQMPPRIEQADSAANRMN
ncbi:hypothetical protein EaACW_1856 [Erwinia amylovora ACW56400]|nr:hypothetical protein EaACW_1856 [Erwinia amylovora ACW56400]CBJ46486.1 hypothetical protein EAM_1811 [Erwinia amylovora ATCC 49946]CCO78702.1 hypothetical protein BN432_1904 [Erwinia amylovora Ea356]CCO82497.1 hypothetical protein BN433_1927 [Erwinia amylovora Ea266]